VCGQIGLEDTPEHYVAQLVEVFAEVRRVLKPNAMGEYRRQLRGKRSRQGRHQ